MTRRKTIRRLTGYVIFTALLWAAPIDAAPQFTLLPAGGSLVGAPGETLGWGYEIVNDDLTHWLVIISLNSDPFEYGTWVDNIFIPPIVAPGMTVTTPYVPGLEGLGEFTWDADAPAGFTQSGLFTIGAEFWDGDPFLGGVPLLEPEPLEFTASYDVSTFGAKPEPVPEPASLTLLGAGLAGVLLLRRRLRLHA